ncbi:MAG: glycoside hydrolase family 3 protein, partial [Myxococcales bacterium]|nr:glycoside hydrolase family 3 protein [Myxococcales bacterium]
MSAATTSSSSSGGSSTSSTTGAASTTGGAADTTTGGGVDEDAIVRYCGDDSAAIEARITDVLAALDVPAKVAMMHGVGLLPTAGAWAVAGNVEQGIPGLHMLDGPRGVSKVSGETATVFPVGMMRGATWDPALEREVGAAMGREVRSVGADVLLAPTMNLLRHPRWGRAQETYGEDTAHVGAMASAFIEGVQSERVIATAKHFAANSIEDTRFDVDVTLDDRTLHEVYLPHFRRAVQDANVGAVMTAYNSVNGQHCDVNPTLLRDTLRGQWGFAGFVMSDWVQGTHGDVEAVRAGLDVEMPSGANFGRLDDAVA